MPTVFEERYKNLNARQREAVDTIEGPVMVVAGPGTGKTTILALRIANILQKTDTPPSGILAITFTEAGVKAMRAKLREIIGGRADEVRIHTFHGFASSVINEFDDRFPHLSRSTQMTDVEAEALMREVLSEPELSGLRPLGDPEFYVGKTLSAISEAKREAWTPDMLRKHAEEEADRIKNDDDSKSSRGPSKGQLKADAVRRIEKCERTVLFARAYARYEELKRERRQMDFDDLIVELLVALRTDETLLRSLQERSLYILVDEHQDTNDSQNLLIRLLADFFERPNLFVVGDEKQAIYRFQGASVENFLGLQKAWGGMKVISLSDNYRSHQAILDAGFSLIERNYMEGEHEQLRVKLAAGGKGQKAKPIDVVFAGNVAAEEAHLAKSVKEVLAADPKATVAVIARTNKAAERARATLEASGVEVASERGADIFAHPVGALFFELVAFLSDPSETESLAHTLAGGMWGLSLTEAGALIKEVRSGNAAAAVEAIPALKKLRDAFAAPDFGALESVVLAGDDSGLANIASKSPLSAEVWRGVVALSAQLAQGPAGASPRTLAQALLSYRQSAEGRSVRVASGPLEAQVRVMTAHGSKGLEFDYVFMPYATEESWVPRARSSYFVMPRERAEDDDVRDVRRLFYVGLTRARKHVTILCGLEESGRELLPVRFIEEIDQAQVARKEVPAAPLAPQRATVSSADRRKIEITEFSKRSLVERGLSVTALNHFMKCPSLFFYKSVLRLPEAPTAVTEKGTAMHEAIAKVWLQDDKSEKAILATLVETIRSYFSRSLLGAAEKEQVVRELVEDAPAVAKALVPHFALAQSLKAEVATESWFETPFRSNDVDIRLHGKLDAVLSAPDKAFVFDYKTRAALSVNAIKGETKTSAKNGDGGYFRQLAFYRLLVESDSRFRGKPVEPALVFVKPDDKGRCQTVSVPVTDADIEELKGNIASVVDAVWSGKIANDVCDDPACSWCALKRLA